MLSVRQRAGASVGSRYEMLPKGAPKPKTIETSMSLTDSRIRTLKPNGKADRLIADGGGLYIRVRAGQSALSRTWQYRRRDSGKLSILTLGTYPDLTVRDARLRAAELAARGNPNTTTIPGGRRSMAC